MSYINPNIPVIQNPVGLDAIIQMIQLSLGTGLPWLQKSFGRAQLFLEKQLDGKVYKIPKAYSGANEYINVLPNDNLISQSFISAKDKEKYINYNNGNQGTHKSRDLSIIFWGNLDKVNAIGDHDYLLENLKHQIEIVLGSLEFLQINAYWDERADIVFNDFTLNDVDTQLLMMPFFACKFDVVVNYFDSICQNEVLSTQINVPVTELGNLRYGKLSLTGETQIVFEPPFPEGSDYVITKPYCWDENGIVGFTITGRINNGFTVNPVKAANFEYYVVKI